MLSSEWPWPSAHYHSTKECSLQQQRRRLYLDWPSAAGASGCRVNSTAVPLIRWSPARLPTFAWCTHARCPSYTLACKARPNKTCDVTDDPSTLSPTIVLSHAPQRSSPFLANQAELAGVRKVYSQTYTSPMYPPEIIPHALVFNADPLFRVSIQVKTNEWMTWLNTRGWRFKTASSRVENSDPSNKLYIMMPWWWLKMIFEKGVILVYEHLVQLMILWIMLTVIDKNIVCVHGYHW